MRIANFSLIDWRTFRGSGRYYPNNAIVHFTPVRPHRSSYRYDNNYNSYNDNYRYDDYGYNNYSNYDNEFSKSVQDMFQDYDSASNIYDDYGNNYNNQMDSSIVEEYNTMMNQDIPDVQMEYSQNDRERYFQLRNNFELSQATFNENCSYLINIIDSGVLYEYSSQEGMDDSVEFSGLLEDLEAIVWGIYTSTDDMFFVYTSQELYETGRLINLQGLTLQQLIDIRDNSYELILIIKKAMELPDMTLDEKDYLLNRILLLRDLIRE